jgi:hypothetical protein
MNTSRRSGSSHVLATERIIAALTAVLAVVTTAWPQWIELLTGADPDRGDGLLEWALVGGLAAAALISAGLAIREARLLRA